MGSLLAKTYCLTNMAEKPHFGSISHFFPNLDPIYSVMVQAATLLHLLAKNIGVVHQSFDVCHDGWLCCKNMWPHEHGRKQLNGSISDF